LGKELRKSRDEEVRFGSLGAGFARLTFEEVIMDFGLGTYPALPEDGKKTTQGERKRANISSFAPEKKGQRASGL
jgi:hypothetical protein